MTIVRSTNPTDSWFEWTERGRNFFRRIIPENRKTLEWVVQILREAFKFRGNGVRRWKKGDSFSETFCARNFNNFGRYISIVSTRGRRRAVLIIPETTFNAG
uniref:Putative ovule protein n=1 Tax=Solanum chacoense TaxID=4108 RepID=A0A0V0HD08_SOLCH